MKLENCPFCGGEAENPSKIFDTHTTCSSRKCPMSHLVLMLDQWNTRANPRAKLEEALREIESWCSERLRFKLHPADRKTYQHVTSIAAKALEENNEPN